MFIVKLMKYQRSENGAPAATTDTSIREVDAIHIKYEEGRRIVQFGDAPGKMIEISIGEAADCSYSIAFIMNGETGRTVETIR